MIAANDPLLGIGIENFQTVYRFYPLPETRPSEKPAQSALLDPPLSGG